MNDHTQQQLYQQAMLSHHKAPVGFERKINVSHSANGVNPACGDEIYLTAEIQNNLIHQLAFSGDSCAICRASASILCQLLENQSVQQALLVSEQLQLALENNSALELHLVQALSPLMIVKKFPVRKQCALLPWLTLERALADKENNNQAEAV